MGNKAIMLSIKPEWCEKILSGEKTIEIRKTKPRLEPPFKCYIYQSGGGGGVVAEFVCDGVYPVAFEYDKKLVDIVVYKRACLTPEQVLDYAGGQKPLYGWEIANLKIYDTPKPLEQFKKWPKETGDGTYWRIAIEKYFDRPPQSWGYVKD